MLLLGVMVVVLLGVSGEGHGAVVCFSGEGHGADGW